MKDRGLLYHDSFKWQGPINNEQFIVLDNET